MSSRNWTTISLSWFKTASEPELREFVRALDNNEIPSGPKLTELKHAFDAECNRRSIRYYEHLSNGEWI